MTDTAALISSLSHGPYVLNSLIELIPKQRLTERRLADRWTIHEQVCHLVDAQSILTERFKLFFEFESPHISAHEPESEPDPQRYMKMDLAVALEQFPVIRSELVTLLRSYPADYWLKTGTHDVFSPYSAKQLLIHTLNVDYTHFFSIEQLGFTNEGLEANILTVL